MSICNVGLRTGDVYQDGVDLHLRGFVPLKFVRDYDSSRQEDSSLGFGWRHNQLHVLLVERESASYHGPHGVVTVPGPGARPGNDGEATMQVRWDGAAILLSDVRGNEFRFEFLGGRREVWHLTSTTDPHGNRFEYRYHAPGLLGRITHPDGRVISLGQDGLGHIASIWVGHSGPGVSGRAMVRYVYDRYGDLREVHHSNGGVTRYAYEGHRLVEHTNPLGGVTYFRYDQFGRCIHTVRDDGTRERVITWNDVDSTVEVRNSRGAVARYTRDGRGQILTETDALGRQRENIYDEQGNLQVVNGGAGTHRVTVFLADRRLLIEQDGGLSTTTEFDEKMRVVASTDGGGSRWSHAYNDASDRVDTVMPTDDTWRFGYDADGWLGWAQDPRGHEFTRRRTGPGRVEYADMFGLRASLQYTVLGLVERMTDGAGAETRFDRDGLGQLNTITYADGRHMQLQHDALGNLTQVVREDGSVTRFEFDRFGTPVAMVDALGRRASMQYDPEGNLIRAVDYLGQTCTMAYDLLNRVTEVRLFDGRSQRYEYDERGGVMAVRDRQNREMLRISRDEAGRIVRKTFGDGWEVAYRWGDRNELLEAADPESSVAFEWTPDLRISAERVNGRTVTYGYDEVGNRSSVTTSDGRVIRYDWDARNRLTRIEDSAGGVYEFSYDERDLFREWRGRALVQRFEFNERQLMTRRVAVHGAEERLIAERAFEYDAPGRLATIRDAASGVAEYRYDVTGALLEARSQAADGYDERYVWDANGNLTATRGGEGMTYGPGNRLLRAGSRSFGYDDDGSVVAMRDGVDETALAYDRQGRLSAIRRSDGTIVRYRYDPLGRRIAKEVGGRVTRFTWDHGTLLSEADGDGRVTDYLFLPGTHIPVGMMRAGEQFDLVLDQAGTPIQAVDVAGESVWSGEMTAFGERRSETVGRVRNPFRFQGQYFDEETGLHYNFTRYYDPVIGRYISQDPAGTRGGANLYRYVSNPLNWVDPFGLSNLVDGVLRIVPICQWNDDQVKDAEKKMDAMNNKIAEKGGITLPSSPAQRCGKSAKEIYEDCQQKAKDAGETPKRNLNETNTKCTNEQADHIIEICAGGGEKDCNNLQPLNESVNKSYGSQVASAVRQNPGALVKQVVLVPQEEECTDRPSVDC